MKRYIVTFIDAGNCEIDEACTFVKAESLRGALHQSFTLDFPDDAVKFVVEEFS